MGVYFALGLAAISCAAAAFALTPLVAFLSRRAGVLDESTGKGRTGPVPLLGGVAIFLALGFGGVASKIEHCHRGETDNGKPGSHRGDAGGVAGEPPDSGGRCRLLQPTM